MKTKKYDIIIAGAGLSGLSLAWYLAEGGYTGSIALIDSTFAPTNDKTWCFWAKESPPFPDVIYRKWDAFQVSVLDLEETIPLKDYHYYAIRSGDFKEMILKRVIELPNVDLIEEGILDMSFQRNRAVLTTKFGDTYLAREIFQSVFTPGKLNREEIRYPLIQHFIGWEVQSNQKVFDPKVPVFMHFDESWSDGVAFMYVLPFSENTALLEYTIFSGSTKDEEIYEDKIIQYIHSNYGFNANEYVVRRKEFGEIPMEDRPYTPWYDKLVMNLGTSAGMPKPSTGYAFMRTQKHVRALADSIIHKQKPVLPYQSPRQFRFYDRLLLHILTNSSEDSLRVFRDLFRRNDITKVLAFLDEETSFLEDLSIMSSVPYLPFLKAIKANLRRSTST